MRNLPCLHAFANGLELDRAAVNAGLTTPHHNGRTEGVNTRTKRFMRQMHGRAGFALLHRILLQWSPRSATIDDGTEPPLGQSRTGTSRTTRPAACTSGDPTLAPRQRADRSNAAQPAPHGQLGPFGPHLGQLFDQFLFDFVPFRAGAR